MNINLGGLDGSRVPILDTVKQFVEKFGGTTMAETIQWAGTVLLSIITVGLFIWTVVTFVKSQTESDVTQQKAKRRQAIKLLIISITIAVLTASAVAIFLELEVGDFSKADPTATALYVSRPSQLLIPQFNLS